MAAMMRQMRKQILTMIALTLGLAGFCAPALGQGATAVGTMIVSDPLTGLAIEGWDPVSYFTETDPVPGSPDFEYVWQGAPWFFANAANRENFIQHSDVYAPQFGGHCAMSMARGYVSDGNPRLYALYKNRLYFFFSSGNRDAFLLAPDKAIADAEAKWATLSKGLSTR